MVQPPLNNREPLEREKKGSRSENEMGIWGYGKGVITLTPKPKQRRFGFKKLNPQNQNDDVLVTSKMTSFWL